MYQYVHTTCTCMNKPREVHVMYLKHKGHLLQCADKINNKYKQNKERLAKLTKILVSASWLIY